MAGDADRGWGLGREIPLHSCLAPPHAEVPSICSAEASLRKKKSPGGRKGIVTQPKFETQVPGVLEKKKKIGVCKLKKKNKQTQTKTKQEHQTCGN